MDNQYSVYHHHHQQHNHQQPPPPHHPAAHHHMQAPPGQMHYQHHQHQHHQQQDHGAHPPPPPFSASSAVAAAEHDYNGSHLTIQGQHQHQHQHHSQYQPDQYQDQYHPYPSHHHQHHPQQHHAQQTPNQSSSSFDWYRAPPAQHQQPTPNPASVAAPPPEADYQSQYQHPHLSSFFGGSGPGSNTQASTSQPTHAQANVPASASSSSAQPAQGKVRSRTDTSLTSASTLLNEDSTDPHYQNKQAQVASAAATLQALASSSVPAKSNSSASASASTSADAAQQSALAAAPISELSALGTPTPAKNGRPAYISPFNKHLGRNRACAACRDRKLRCDGVKPICSQCQRAWEARRRGRKGSANASLPDELTSCPPPPCVYMTLPSTLSSSRAASSSHQHAGEGIEDISMGQGDGQSNGHDGSGDHSVNGRHEGGVDGCAKKKGHGTARSATSEAGDHLDLAGNGAENAAASGGGGGRNGKLGALPGSLAGAAVKSKAKAAKRNAEIMKLEKENAELRKRLEMLEVGSRASEKMSQQQAHGPSLDWAMNPIVAPGGPVGLGDLLVAVSTSSSSTTGIGGAPGGDASASASVISPSVSSAAAVGTAASAEPFMSLARHYAALNGAADQPNVIAAAANAAAAAAAAAAIAGTSSGQSGTAAAGGGATAERGGTGQDNSTAGGILNGLGVTPASGHMIPLGSHQHQQQHQQPQLVADGMRQFGLDALDGPGNLDSVAVSLAASTASGANIYGTQTPAFATGGVVRGLNANGSASIMDAPLLEIGSSVKGLSPSSDAFAAAVPSSSSAAAAAAAAMAGSLPSHFATGGAAGVPLVGSAIAGVGPGGGSAADPSAISPQVYGQGGGMTFTGWPVDFPAVQVFDQLIEVFFKYVASMFPMMHRARFHARLLLGPLHSRFPHASLLHAMFALSYTMMPELDDSTPSPTIYAKGALNGKGVSRGTRAQFHAERSKSHIQQGTHEGQNVYDICQASVLMAIHKYASGELIDAWMLSASCLRIAVPLGLSRMGPETTVDAKEREREREARWEEVVVVNGSAGAGGAELGSDAAKQGGGRGRGAVSASGNEVDVSSGSAGITPASATGPGSASGAIPSPSQPKSADHQSYTTILARKPIHIMRLAIMPPPQDWIDEEERRRTFWIAFICDRNASSATLWSPSMGEESVKTELPVADLRAYWNSDSSSKQPLERRQNLSSYDLFTDSYGDSFQLQVKASILYSRCATYVGRMNDFVSVDEFVTPEFHKLNLDIQHLMQTLPPHLQDLLQPCAVSGTTDGKLVIAHILPQSATLVLNQPLAELSPDAAARCQAAITNILRILELLASAGANLVHSPPIFSYLVCNVGRALIRRWKEMRKDAPAELLLTSEGTIGEPIHAAEAALRKEIDLVFFALCQYGQRWPLGMRQAQVMARLMGIEMDPALYTHGLFFEDDITEVHH